MRILRRFPTPSLAQYTIEENEIVYVHANLDTVTYLWLHTSDTYHSLLSTANETYSSYAAGCFPFLRINAYDCTTTRRTIVSRQFIQLVSSLRCTYILMVLPKQTATFYNIYSRCWRVSKKKKRLSNGRHFILDAIDTSTTIQHQLQFRMLYYQCMHYPRKGKMK